MPEPHTSQTPLTSLRRQPRQQRSSDRVHLMLDAAAQLLSTVGPAGTTITAVAERTGVATSSLYEYVEGDRELIGAVAERGLLAIHLELTELMTAIESPEQFIEALSAGLRLFLRRFREEIGLREALAFTDADPALSSLNLSDTRRNAELLRSTASRFWPDTDHSSTWLLLTHFSGGLAGLAAQVDDDEAEELTKEFESLLALLFSL